MSNAIINSIDHYLQNVPKDQTIAFKNIRNTILQNLPKGFEEQISYGMLGYVVPHSIYPNGYHCDPTQPLPFVSLASQKKYIALYHMGLYADETLQKWFKTEYAKSYSSALDMGKSCVRFKKLDSIPYPLIEQLLKKISVNDWITLYEAKLKR